MFTGGFLTSIIFIAIVIAFPFISKFAFKTQGMTGFGSGILTSFLCHIGMGVGTGVWFALVNSHMNSIGVTSYSIPYMLAFSEWYDYANKPWELGQYASIMFLITCVFVYPFIFIFLKRLKNRAQEKNEVFSFISGFNTLFCIAFFIAFLAALGAVGSGETYDQYRLVYRHYNSYDTLLFKFNFFAFTFMLGCMATTLVLYLYIYGGKIIWLFASLGMFYIPVIFPFIGVASESPFTSDILAPIFYILECIAAFFIFFKLDNSGDVGYIAASPI